MPLIDINGVKWKDFFIKEIFDEIKRGKRLIHDHQLDGLIPYVSSSSLNNGVDNFIDNDTGVRKYRDCLSLANSGSVGSCFYEPFEFIASDHITHLKNRKLNRYHYLFLATALNRLSEKYNFNREINDTRISREKVLLPVDERGKPNWLFMENYMQDKMKKKYQVYLLYIEKINKKVAQA